MNSTNDLDKIFEIVKRIKNESYCGENFCEVKDEISKDNWRKKTLLDIASDVGKIYKLKGLLERDKEFNDRKREIRINIPNNTTKITDLDIKEISYCGDIVFLPNSGTLYVIGDTHGDAESVNRIISRIDFDKDVYIVFLGDYVNNGLNSIDNLIKVLQLKELHRERHGDKIVLLSGNHEFRETYYTVLNEFFVTHWNNFIKNPTDKVPPNHYGHIRLELITNFGFDQGEKIYDLFADWGKSLPYLAFSKKGIMMSHSIGPKDIKQISLKELADSKQNSGDFKYIEDYGYESWKEKRPSLHARMVNNDDIEPNLLNTFKRDLGVNVFVVGHRHYRSGDIHRNGNMHWSDVRNNGIFVTISSSHENSRDAGHYIEHQYEYERPRKTNEERLGRAKACYAVFRSRLVININKYNNIRDVR